MPGPLEACATGLLDTAMTGTNGLPAAKVVEAGSRETPAPLTFLAEEEARTCPTKLFIGGISRHTTTKQLRDHFSQFGRVLDCVAMRQPDGRPRGFGYVTLDSPAAAERCLSEPQCIDNRIVDMKPAVPEGTASSGNTSPKEADLHLTMYAGHGFGGWLEAGMYGNTVPWWANGPLHKTSGQSQGLDCVDILSRGGHSPHGLPLQSLGAPSSLLQEFSDLAAHDPFEGTGLLLPPHMTESDLISAADTQWQLAGTSPTGASPTLSASAPEFVPLGAQGAPEPAPASRAPKPMATTPSNNRKAGRSRAPLGELTNIVEVEDLLKPFKSPTNKNADIGHGHLSAQRAENQSESSESPAPGGADLGGLSSYLRPTGLLLGDEDLNAQSSSPSINAGASSSTLSPHSTSGEVEEGKVQEDDNVNSLSSNDDDNESDSDESEQPVDVSGAGRRGEVAVDDLDSLPSMGSAFHSTGECKRCNFFPKGRCQNGKDCSFCHFPHDKRKPSRQEKRERRAAWMEQIGEKQEVEASPSLGEPTCCPQQLQQALHHPSLLGKRGPFAVYQDDEVYSDETLAYSIFPGLPPILATKLPAPLPLPGTMDVLGQGGPALPPGLTPPQRTAQPWQPEVEASPAAHTALPPGPLPSMLDQHAMQQVVSSTPLTSAPLSTAPTPTATPTAAASGEARTFSMTMSSSGTQTNEDYMCRRCEESGKGRSDPEDNGITRSRDELLRLRGGRNTGSQTVLFRTMAVSTPAGV